jgi:hypothetical protein
MFEKFGRLADGLVSRVSTSRRGFLGRVGRSALGVAGALGALGVAASAGSGGVVCCVYSTLYKHSRKVCLPAGSTCPSTIDCGGYGSCYLLRTQTKSDCSKC